MRTRLLTVITLGITAAAFVLLGAGPALATVRTVGPGVPADCSTDVTASLQSWLDTTVVDGDTVQLPSGACYRVDGTITLTDRNNLTFTGLTAGATIKMVTTPAASPKIRHDMFNITGGSGISFSNITFQSTNTTTGYQPDREWWPIFQDNGSANLTLDNVHGINVWGDFLEMDPDSRPTPDVMTNNVTLKNSSVNRVGRHGVTCEGCTHVSVDNNTFSNIGYHAFDIEVEASAWYADTVGFTNNTISGYQRLGIVANAGSGNHVTNVTITGNNNTAATLQTCQPPVQVVDTPDTKNHWTISGNNFKTLGVGIDISGVDYVTVQNNLVHLNAGGCSNQTTAMKVSNTSHDTVTGNDFQGADRLVPAGATFGTGSTVCGNRLSRVDGNFNKPAAC